MDGGSGDDYLIIYCLREISLILVFSYIFFEVGEYGEENLVDLMELVNRYIFYNVL